VTEERLDGLPRSPEIQAFQELKEDCLARAPAASNSRLLHPSDVDTASARQPGQEPRPGGSPLVSTAVGGDSNGSILSPAAAATVSEAPGAATSRSGSIRPREAADEPADVAAERLRAEALWAAALPGGLSSHGNRVPALLLHSLRKVG
jgi:hypothetical protein